MLSELWLVGSEIYDLQLPIFSEIHVQVMKLFNLHHHTVRSGTTFSTFREQKECFHQTLYSLPPEFHVVGEVHLFKSAYLFSTGGFSSSLLALKSAHLFQYTNFVSN
jgi:Tfp pilus assembly protein PilO